MRFSVSFGFVLMAASAVNSKAEAQGHTGDIQATDDVHVTGAGPEPPPECVDLSFPVRDTGTLEDARITRIMPHPGEWVSLCANVNRVPDRRIAPT